MLNLHQNLLLLDNHFSRIDFQVVQKKTTSLCFHFHHTQHHTQITIFQLSEWTLQDILRECSRQLEREIILRKN